MGNRTIHLIYPQCRAYATFGNTPQTDAFGVATALKLSRSYPHYLSLVAFSGQYDGFLAGNAIYADTNDTDRF